MDHEIQQLFGHLWSHYVDVTPSAERIHRLLGAYQNGPIINDHIALRTFNLEKVNLDKLADHFRRLGYEEGGEYRFEAKKLEARHYEHPDPEAPKVFISQLLLEDCSRALRETIQALIDPLADDIARKPGFLYSGRHWPINYATYRKLAEESEYAAWVAAWGWQANHFTVSINDLEGFESLSEVNELLKREGFRLNDAGGEIKGSPEDYLEQSSTMADRIRMKFDDQSQIIPSCFYEFARRYPMPDGRLYQGFVPASADRIFESTNAD